MYGLLRRTGKGNPGVPYTRMRPLALSNGETTDYGERVTNR